jgi:hypothetical protein
VAIVSHVVDANPQQFLYHELQVCSRVAKKYWNKEEEEEHVNSKPVEIILFSVALSAIRILRLRWSLEDTKLQFSFPIPYGFHIDNTNYPRLPRKNPEWALQQALKEIDSILQPEKSEGESGVGTKASVLQTE